jgi:hypothetical protein
LRFGIEFPHFMPNTVTCALPFQKPFVSYQKSIQRTLRFSDTLQIDLSAFST